MASIPHPQLFRNVAYGLNQGFYVTPTSPIVALRNPTTSDRAPIGTTWINTVLNTEFTIVNVTGGLAQWKISSINPVASTVASPTATVTSNNRMVVATFTGYTTAGAATQNFTINDSNILTTSGLLVNIATLNTSGNGATLEITGIIQAAGSIIVETVNPTGAALGLGDNVIITVWVVS
jgi:hypothetical protein